MTPLVGQREEQQQTPGQRSHRLRAAEQQAEDRQRPNGSTQDPSSLRHRDQADTGEHDEERPQQHLRAAHSTDRGDPGEGAEPVHPQLIGAAQCEVLGQVPQTEIAVVPQPVPCPRHPWQDARLHSAHQRGEDSGATPGQYESRHARVVRRQVQQRNQGERPGDVADERLATLARREERESPTVLQHQPGQNDAQCDEGRAGVAAERCADGGTDRSARDTDDDRHPRRACDRRAPDLALDAAEANRQRIRRQTTRDVDHHAVRHPGQAERAELERSERTGDDDAHDEAHQTGHGLVS